MKTTCQGQEGATLIIEFRGTYLACMRETLILIKQINNKQIWTKLVIAVKGNDESNHIVNK